MKITHLIYSFTTGGAETMLVDIVNEQVKQALVSIVIINKKYNLTLVDKIDKQVKVFFINRIEGSKNPFPILKLNCLLLQLDADVLHCHNHNIVPLLLPSLKRKTILTLHCMGIPTNYVHNYNQLIAISESVKNDIYDRCHLKSKVIYNGIRTNSIKTKGNSITNDIFRIVCIGRLEHEIKGQHLVIEALHILHQKGINNLQLDIIGTGNSEEFLKELSKKYDLIDQVNFLGLKDRDFIYNNLKDYDLLIQPSIYEGFGLTVVEGMAAKIPVLVSDINGPIEIINNGQYGYFFKTNNVNNLVSQLIYIIKNHTTEEITDKVNSAYTYVKDNFEISTTATKYIEIYS